MKSHRFCLVLLASLAGVITYSRGADANNSFDGDWALTIPGVNAGWLGVKTDGDQIHAEMLWGGGSVFPLEEARLEDGKLVLTRLHKINHKTPDGKTNKVELTETIKVTREGDSLKLASVKQKENGNGEEHSEFTGKRLPPMPPAPDLSAIRFGDPIQLFDGKSLDGWKLVEPDAFNGWSVHDGILSNAASEGETHKHYGNLRTVAEFEDFALHAETRLAKHGNSGIYLRGIYEVQVADTYGKPLDSHNMGAIYSRIKPTASAEKPPGEWQTLDITYVDRHATVVLNGTKIIDNQPILGPTGGALWPEVDRPGPIYLQGDHTGIEYRNIVLKPVVH